MGCRLPEPLSAYYTEHSPMHLGAKHPCKGAGGLHSSAGELHDGKGPRVSRNVRFRESDRETLEASRSGRKLASPYQKLLGVSNMQQLRNPEMTSHVSTNDVGISAGESPSCWLDAQASQGFPVHLEPSSTLTMPTSTCSSLARRAVKSGNGL